MIRYPEESEEQIIDRLLRDLGISLPQIDQDSGDSFELAPEVDAGESMLLEDISERRSARLS